MPDSDLIYVEGNPAFIGTPGDHDFEFEEDKSIADSGDTGFAFTEGSSFGGSTRIIDDLNRGDLSPYEGGNSSVFGVTTSPTWEGSHALVCPNNSLVSGTQMWDDDGLNDLPNYPSPGQTIQARMYFGNTNPDNNAKLGFLWGVDDSVTRSSPTALARSYSIEVRPGKTDFTIRLYMAPDGNDSKDLGTFSIDSWNYSNEWVRLQINWGTDGLISGTLYTEGTSESPGEVIVSGEANDTTIQEQGGVGWFRQSGGPYYADLYEIVG